MSKASIRAIDAHCKVCNWDSSLQNAYPKEVGLWSRKRDRALKQLRKALAQTTQEEFLRGRWGYTPMEERISQWNEMVARAADGVS